MDVYLQWIVDAGITSDCGHCQVIPGFVFFSLQNRISPLPIAGSLSDIMGAKTIKFTGFKEHGPIPEGRLNCWRRALRFDRRLGERKEQGRDEENG
uniref:Uncharacterized protein n=1 Tax=Ditylenchus dipsaci TaxID=166011 RepID=A0A915D4F7_9BILA